MDFSNLSVEELEKNKKALNKMILAYWLSIPSDTDSAPTKIEITRIDKDGYRYIKYNRNNKVYGMGSIRRDSIVTYIDKVQYMNEKNQELFDSTEKGKI